MRYFGIFFALSLVLLAGTASAYVPHLISVQGRLTDNVGNPITSPTRFVFGMYSSATGGVPAWTETQTLTPDTNGVFSALLGSVNALTLTFSQGYWLGVEVGPAGSSQILSPRQQIGSSAYAIQSEQPWNVTGTNVYTNAGNVGIGTSAPTEKLEVAGNVKATAFKGDGSQLTGIASSQWANSGSNIYYNTGNVGIGTAGPVAPLDVSGYLHVSGNTNPSTPSQGGYLGWNALTGGTGETDFINNQGGGSGGFAFMNTPSSGSPRTTLMYITGGGNVGIGTTTPGAKLDVAGDVRVSGEIRTPSNEGNCPLWKDCDGDGKTGGSGDCDESCPTCYVGSTASTYTADGKDQNCNGLIDDDYITPQETYGMNDADCTYVPNGPRKWTEDTAVDSACVATCDIAGVGCIASTCVAVNVANTVASGGYLACASIGGRHFYSQTTASAGSWAYYCKCYTRRYY